MPNDENPQLGMCFEIFANGVSLGSFSECSGLTVDIGSEDYKEGGQNHFTHKLPTHASTPPVILKRGLSGSLALWTWISTFVEASRVVCMTLIVQLRTPGRGGKVFRTWVVDSAYPLKWEGPKLDAMRGEVAFESIELAHHGVRFGA